MNKVLIIAKRELQAYFDSLIAYILLGIFLAVSGYFTWLSAQNIFFYDEASLTGLQSPMWVPNILLCIIIPAITMRLIAEEKKTGTLELLLTKAVSDRQVVTGKFLAALILVLSGIALTLPYYFTLIYLGRVDHGAVLCGYLSMSLMSAAYLSLGIFASSLTSNQIVAFLTGLSLNLLFHIVFFNLPAYSAGPAAEFFSFLAVPTHCESLSRGVIDSADLIYFAGLIFLGLAFAELSLSSRHADTGEEAS